MDILSINYSVNDILQWIMDTDYLPSARFTKIVLGTLVVVAIGVAIYRSAPVIQVAWTEFWAEHREQQQRENADAFGEYRDLDTDGDGLLDWEESLFGTNIEQSDTDGDGISDYVEYRAANPAASDNALGSTSVTPSDILDSQDEFDPTNLTDSLARDLYTSLSVVDQQSGGKVSEEDNDKLASIAAQTVQSFSAKTYLVSDITTISTPTRAQKTQFVTSLNQVWIDSGLTPSDVQSMLSSINNDASISPAIIAKIPTWKTVGVRLAQIPVPATVASDYVEYLNATEKYMSVLVAIANNDTDPARAIGAVLALEEALDSVARIDTLIRSHSSLN